MTRRAAAGTKRGRQLAQAKGARIADESTIPAAIREHNALVEQARAERLARRQGKHPTLTQTLASAGVVSLEAPQSDIRKALGRPYGR